jgi:GNAT superfamily N-acetyltransferase
MSSFNNLKALALEAKMNAEAKGYELAYSSHVELGREHITMNFLFNGCSVGYVVLDNIHENSSGCWSIGVSHVDKAHRGQGLGKGLYLAAFLFAAIKAVSKGQKASFLPNCSLYLPQHMIENTSPDACRVWVSIGRQLCQPVVDIKQYLLVIGA